MSSQQTAPIRWDLLHPDFHQICEIEYLTRKVRAQASRNEWQQDHSIIEYATALLRRFALQSTKIVHSPTEDGQVNAFVVWILQIGNLPYLPWHANKRYAMGSDDPDTTPCISWSARPIEPESAKSRLEFVQKDLNIAVNVSPEDYRSDFAHLRHVHFPIFQIAQLLLPGLSHRIDKDAKIWCISQFSTRPGFEDRAQLKTTIEKHFKVLDDNRLHAYHLAEPKNVWLFEELGFRELFKVDLHVGSTAVFHSTLMMRWPVLPDSDDDNFDEAQMDEPDYRLGLENYQAEGRSFHVEFEDKELEDKTPTTGELVKLPSFDRLKWKSSWWQTDVGQLSLSWKEIDDDLC
ncbi:hypothetical protein HD806DRAFT_345293 [Xylariaceae sp. AK1471]|nr:hypothetical protein HD806DRAFT_345293 [Xylariaceae sp. AK1471]